MKRNVDIDYVWPYQTYAVVDGKRLEYNFEKLALTPVDQAFDALDTKNEKKISKQAAIDFAVAASVPKTKLSEKPLKAHLSKTEFAEFVKSFSISDVQIEKFLKSKKTK